MTGACPRCAPPPPKEIAGWSETLHWIVRILPPGHPDVSFAASLLHHSIERPGLTERQARYAQRLLGRARDEYCGSAGEAPEAVDLARLSPAGRA